MDVRVPVTARDEPPPDDELAWEEEEGEEEEGEEEEGAEQADRETGTRAYLPSLRFLGGMAALGVVLALGWRYSGAGDWAAGTFRPAIASQPAAGAAAQAESDPARATRDIEALKKTVAELAAANQQMAATIATLQVAQQELRQRPAGFPMTPWHSQPAAMKYRIVAQPRSTTGSIAPRATTARAEPHGAPKSGERAPLALTAPRP